MKNQLKNKEIRVWIFAKKPSQKRINKVPLNSLRLIIFYFKVNQLPTKTTQKKEKLVHQLLNIHNSWSSLKSMELFRIIHHRFQYPRMIKRIISRTHFISVKNPIICLQNQLIMDHNHILLILWLHHQINNLGIKVVT